MGISDPVQNDTIAAPATPAGESALAVLRVSGPLSAALAAVLHGGSPPPPRCAMHGDYRALDGRMLDEVVYTLFVAPASFTGEDSLEICCHGSPLVVRKILEDLLARGCRPAEPGEYTRRAFLNGRIDLTQAEAVMDLIRARSDRALEAANRQLRGALGRRITGLVEGLEGVLAEVEARIDFPEEDLPREDARRLREVIAGIRADVGGLRAARRYGDILRDGLRVVLAGPPNAGKSSLFNRLAGFERALVSEEAGTTRDFIEERVLIGPHVIRLQDTAGLNPAPGRIEAMGMVCTRDLLGQADLVLLVVEGGAPLPHPGWELQIPGDPGRIVVVANKSDMGPPPVLTGALAGARRISTCAVSGAGIGELRSAIGTHADSLCPDPAGQDVVVVNARHARDLAEAGGALAAAEGGLDGGMAMELVAGDLREAWRALTRVAGRSADPEAILDRIFREFCIGK